MRRTVLGALGIACSALLIGAGTGGAAPDSGSSSPGSPQPQTRSGPANVVKVDELSPTRSAVFIDSPAMNRVVQVQILHPAAQTGARPSFYLLDGVDSTNDQSSWTKKTDVERFFADKNVNVVLPVGGMGSFYTDWQRADPALGINRWETFLTQELPPIVQDRFDGNNSRAIGGLSMGGQAALILASRHPDLYRGIAAYSACGNTSQQNSKNAVRATVASRGGDATNMWGPDTDPAWITHDPTTNAEKLRGKTIYMAVGNGLPGPHEFTGGQLDLGTAVTQGGPLEYGALMCTQQFQQRLTSLGIPARVDYRPWGTHSWPYWQDDLHDSWPTVASALGA